MPANRITLTLTGILLLGLGYLLWPFIVGGERMESFCSTLTIGSTLNEVKRAVSDRGYRIALGKDVRGYVHDPKAFGRFVCAVNFEGDRLVSTKYSVSD